MNRNIGPYPWQQTAWQSLIERQRSGKLPHALLFSGPAGIGKRGLAIGLARALLCLEPKTDSGEACGHCRSCQLFTAGSHPDFQLVEPEEEGKGIGVDAIRQLIGSQSLTGQYSEQRVVVLHPADRININGANALLKTLEEPNSGTTLILVTERPAGLLATIRSRCQQLPLRGVDRPSALHWLAQFSLKQDPAELLTMAAGAPLRALEMAEGGELEQRAALLDEMVAIAEQRRDPVAAAEKLGDKGLATRLNWLYQWLTALIRQQQSGITSDEREGIESRRLAAINPHLDIRHLFHILETLEQALRLSGGQLNRQVLMEDILLQWQRLFQLKAPR